MKSSSKTALDAALHLIAYRAQSEWEIRSKLRLKGYRDEETEAAVRRLLELGYLDDRALAEEIFLMYKREGLYGNRYIREKLKSRGLSTEARLTEEEETDKACRALAKKTAVSPTYTADREKAAAFLFRRGFSGTAVRAALQSMKSDDKFFED